MIYVNSTELFLDTIGIEKVVGRVVEDVYNDYVKWCEEHNYYCFTKSGLSKHAHKKFNIRVYRIRMNGKLVGVYER